jgi:hypothetical protein
MAFLTAPPIDSGSAPTALTELLDVLMPTGPVILANPFVVEFEIGSFATNPTFGFATP